MWSERFAGFLYRRRYVLFAAWLIHTFLLHYYVLGFVSWDGFGHRGFPIVELLQHGTYGVGKFPNEWSLVGFTWFIELAHLPFIALFGMKGFLIGFPLVVFPLCVAAVFALLHELTGKPIVATFGTLAYIAMPFINAQPFSAYVDFAVSGCLAFWMYALLRMRADKLRVWDYVRFVAATLIFTMARVQAFYVAILVFAVIAYALWIRRSGWKLSFTDSRRLLLVLGLLVLGMVPSLYLQISRYMDYGSPTYPIQFSLLGLKLGASGFTRDYFFKLAGIGGDDWGSVLRGFFEGWVWYGHWPIGAFFSSKYMAAGLLFVLAVLLLPFGVRSLTRLEWFVLLGLGAVSLLTRDFAVPRYSYTVVLGLTVVLGRELAALAESLRWRAMFWVAVVVVLAHLARPELEYEEFKHHQVTPRMNAAGSSHYLHSWDVPVWPDSDAQLIILETPWSNFILPLYGKHLGNDILLEVPRANIGPHCEGLRVFAAAVPRAVFVDDQQLMKDCPKECGLLVKGECRAWHLSP